MTKHATKTAVSRINKGFKKDLLLTLVSVGLFFIYSLNSASSATVTWDGEGTDGTCGGGVGDGNKLSCGASWSTSE